MLDEKNLYIAIGDKIKKIRKNNGFSQNDLARNIGLERTSVTNIESGNQKASIFVLYQICDLFKLDIASLLPDQEEVKVHKVVSGRDREVDVGSKTMSIIDQLRKNQ